MIPSTTLDHKRFPAEFLNFLAGRFNGVVGEKVFVVKNNNFIVRFERHKNDNTTVVTHLYTKLVQSLQVIKSKYVINDHKHIKLKLNQDEESIAIKLIGVLFIPPNKIFNLFNLILWYFIKFKTGVKPNATEYGTDLVKAWRNEDKRTRNQIMRSPRKVKVSYEKFPCQICGNPSFLANEWEFNQPGKSSQFLETWVCSEHRSFVF